MSQSPEVVWVGDQTESPDIEELGQFDSASPFDVIPSWLKADAAADTDWENLRSYKCALCGELCINPLENPLSDMSLCRSCLVEETSRIRAMMDEGTRPERFADVFEIAQNNA